MNISPTLMLIIGLCATALFVTVFVVSLVVTMRNRRLIQRYAEQSTTESAGQDEQSNGR